MSVYQTIGSEWVGSIGSSAVRSTIQALPNGGYVVAWNVGNNYDSEVKAQFFNANGVAQGPELLVAGAAGFPTFDVKGNVSIGVLDNGNVVISFDQTFAGTNGNGILARVYDPSGTPLTTIFPAASYNSSFFNAYSPQIVAAGGDEFWVVSSAQIANGFNGAWVQRVDSDGNILSPREALVYSSISNSYNFSIERLSDGSFAGTWLEQGAVGASLKVRTFDTSLSPVSSILTVSTISPFSVGHEPKITALAAGGFVVGFVNYDASVASSYSMNLQFFDSKGQPTGAAVNLGATVSTLGIDIDQLADGNLMVTYMQPNTGIQGQDFELSVAQLISSTGSILGAPFPVTATNIQNYPETAILTGGEIATTYVGANNSNGSGGYSVKSRVFNDFANGGTAGDDIIVVRQGHTGSVNGLDGNDIITGSSGIDRLFGGSGLDEIFGGDGNDIIDGGTGIDEMHGGGGNDTFTIDNASDRVFESANQGIDTMKSAVVDFTLAANVEKGLVTGLLDLDITGNDLANTLTGNARANVLRGGEGKDILNGNDGQDSLFGDGGNDTLNGGSGNDSLSGGTGIDLLTGGAGVDILTGGSEADQFKFDKFTVSDGLSAIDRITDFSGIGGDRDRINLSAIDANGNAGDGNQKFGFIGTAAFGGVAGQLRYEQVGGVTRVLGDTDGDGIADFQIDAVGAINFTSGDFIL